MWVLGVADVTAGGGGSCGLGVADVTARGGGACGLWALRMLQVRKGLPAEEESDGTDPDDEDDDEVKP